jgi:hypothetical protein
VSAEVGVMIEVFGEGKADLGRDAEPGPPTQGIVPILLHRLCNRPRNMLVKRNAYAFLHGKGLPQKVRFARRQAFYNRSAGAVFVIDSEGDQSDLKKKKAELEQGRSYDFPEFPTAIGVAQPCIESWLLADGAAIRRALELPATPAVPEQPEQLPAPCRDAGNNPKAVLSAAVGSRKQDLSAADKDKIARAMNDLDLVRARCPLGFAPFADEVDKRIRPLF